MGLASNQDLIANHSKQANSGEIDHSSVPDNLSSFGDIKGAILTEWAGGNAAAAPTKEKAPVVLSERAAKAKAYTAAYEDVMLPRQGEFFFFFFFFFFLHQMQNNLTNSGKATCYSD